MAEPVRPLVSVHHISVESDMMNQDCDSSYIEEMGRKVKTRLGEHKMDVDSELLKLSFTRA